jgi:hypothetical protein
MNPFLIQFPPASCISMHFWLQIFVTAPYSVATTVYVLGLKSDISFPVKKLQGKL